MDESLRTLFYAHLTEMALQATQVNPSMKAFYRQNGSKEEVLEKLNLKGNLTLQSRLDRLFPNEFRVKSGLVSFTERSKHEKMVEEQVILRQQRLEAHILAAQKAAQIHFENHRPRTIRNQTKLLPLRRKSRGKDCPTCGVKMSASDGLFGLTIEHIVPVRFGGENSYDGEFPQCVGMCYLCNQSRNEIVKNIGIEEVGNREKISNRAIRFLITQLYGKPDEIDSQMSQMFLDHYQLVSSQGTPVEQYDLWGIGEWIEFQIPSEESPAPESAELSDTEEENPEPVYLELSKEDAIANLKMDLEQAIEMCNKGGKPYPLARLERLFLMHGSLEQFKVKIGMQDEDINTILSRLYPRHFIMETKGKVQFIHVLEKKNAHFYNFAAEVAVPPVSKTNHEQGRVDADTVRADPVPVSMPVLFVRDGIASLPLSIEQRQIPFERIREVLDGLRKEDGMDWEAYLHCFNIEHSGNLAEGIYLLLTKCGFKGRLTEMDGNLFFDFELPHSFEEHQAA